jgi:hypothetical protein
MRLNNVGSTSDVVTAPNPTLQPVEANDNDLHHDFPNELYIYTNGTVPIKKSR